MPSFEVRDTCSSCHIYTNHALHLVPTPFATITTLNPVVLVRGNITLTCNIQLDPSVDSTVMVNSTWTAPGGATLSGSNPSWTGSSYQSTLMLTSLGTGNAGNYTCLALISPINNSFLLRASGISSILG